MLFFWFEIGPGFEEPAGTTPPKFPRSTPRDVNEEITVEPRYNEGPRDWQYVSLRAKLSWALWRRGGRESARAPRRLAGQQYVSAVRRFRYIEVLSHIFYYHWGKKKSFVIRRKSLEVRNIRRFHCTYKYQNA